MAYLRTMRDYDGEPTTFTVPSETLTAANFDAQVALNVALGVAIVGITRGEMARISYGNDIFGVLKSDDPLCQRENRWLVRYHDVTTGKNLRRELGTADLTLLDPNNRGFAQIGDAGPVDAFVTAFEAFVLSDAGNAVEIDSIQFVGANI